MKCFDQFIADLRGIWADTDDLKARMTRAKTLIEVLLQDKDLLAASKDWPCTDPHKNLLFYEDPDYGFVINGVVRTPGRKGGIHDHAQAWVLYGLLDGTETLERYERIDDRSKPGYAEVRLTSAPQGSPGQADLVPPYDIHSEKGGPDRSVAVIVRSERLVGRCLQGRYNPETNEYHEGHGPDQIPYQIT